LLSLLDLRSLLEYGDVMTDFAIHVLRSVMVALVFTAILLLTMPARAQGYRGLDVNICLFGGCGDRWGPPPWRPRLIQGGIIFEVARQIQLAAC
jgi:hypothetical protein